ncbi:Glomulin [Bagarius yarrelli]|uniref:Glomulin n=1 Tax=Bagarius yarrelli TaxID=175774 RepID=A0A556V3M5_BAGYA|nr:Glomulin [Bagarius yarrelli]
MALEQFSDVVQRCQHVQEQNFSPSDFELFRTAGTSCIEQGHAAHVLSVIIDQKNETIVRCMGWNLLEPLVKILLKKEEKNLHHCHAIFSHLLQVCSPKELLVGLLEQVEEADPDAVAEVITLLLTPLQTGKNHLHCTSPAPDRIRSAFISEELLIINAVWRIKNTN